MADSLDKAITKLETKFNAVLKQCYEALAADAPQEKRDALREAINEFLRTSDTEE
jgi:hypothetical protein